MFDLVTRRPAALLALTLLVAATLPSLAVALSVAMHGNGAMTLVTVWGLALVGAALITVLIGAGGITGLYALVGASACMSLMFPTIYGVALKGLGEDTKIAAAGLIMAILGGSVMPPIQAAIIDLETVGGFSAVRLSFVLPVVSFIVIAIYGRRVANQKSI